MHDAVIASTYNPVDVLAELFKEGANDPSKLMEHPSPPGTKNKTMRTDLMSFQVRSSPFFVEFKLTLRCSGKDWPGWSRWSTHNSRRLSTTILYNSGS